VQSTQRRQLLTADFPALSELPARAGIGGRGLALWCQHRGGILGHL